MRGSEYGSGEAPPQPIELRAAKPWVPTDRLSHEFEAVGFFLTGHPLDDYHDVLEALGAESWAEFAAKARMRRVVGTLAGTVLATRQRQGKSGNAYAFVAFSDPTGQFEAVVFSEALKQGLHAFTRVFHQAEARSAIWLTLLVAVIAVPVNMVFGVAAAWLMARFEFRGKALLGGADWRSQVLWPTLIGLGALVLSSLIPLLARRRLRPAPEAL